MPIRPIDIRRKEFKSSFRGYDANQVDDFLDAVADEFERTYTENSRMGEEISGLRDRLGQFEELEGSIRSALVQAERAAEDLRNSAGQEADAVRDNARQEADFTINEAKARAHRMLSDSSSRVDYVQQSYEALQEAKRNFSNDFRHLLKTYTDMMDKMELNSAREIEAALRDRMDPESIAVAREAAQHQPADEEDATQRIDPGPLAEAREAENGEAENGDAPDVEPGDDEEATEAETQGEPETQEPEHEPSTAEEGRSEAVGPEATEEAADDVEREEDAPETRRGGGPLSEESDGESPSREAPFGDEEDENDDFFERQDQGENSRIFRASRFLRRRDR